MTKDEVRIAWSLIEEIRQLEGYALDVERAKDLSFGTSGHSLFRVKADEKESLFPQIKGLVAQEIQRRLLRAKNKLRTMGVFDTEKAA